MHAKYLSKSLKERHNLGYMCEYLSIIFKYIRIKVLLWVRNKLTFQRTTLKWSLVNRVKWLRVPQQGEILSSVVIINFFVRTPCSYLQFVILI
jgi:hypothetical protein